ncbi:unnamed protein product [Closterium sp. NIES-54]
MLNQPLTELLGRLSLAPTLSLLALTTTRASTLRSRPTTTGHTTSTAATPSAASTTATRAATSATGPTTATTSTASTSSTAAPTATPIATSTTPATLALADYELEGDEHGGLVCGKKLGRDGRAVASIASAQSELQKRHTCTDLGELPSYLGLQITQERAQRTITMTESHMLHQVLQRFCFQFSSPQPTPLSTGHSLSAPPSDETVEPSGPYAELVGCLMDLMTCTRPDLATSGMGLVLGGRGPAFLTGHADASWVDDSTTQRSSQGYTFSLGSGSVSWWSTCLSSVLSSNCEAEIYAGAMAAQELRWLTYLLTDLGEQPHSPPFLYVDNKAMIALCREHRLEHRTKHIALRYFLASELQQRGQLRLAYVATRANTSDIFTKALPPGDH